MGVFGNLDRVKDINSYCRNAGFILIGLGVLHLILSGILDSFWGCILIIIGIISLLYRKRPMLIVFGVALIFVGLSNIFNSIAYMEGSGLWLIFGVFQIIWGIQEIRRYSKTKNDLKKPIKEKVANQEKIKGNWLKRHFMGVMRTLLVYLLIGMFLKNLWVMLSALALIFLASWLSDKFDLNPPDVKEKWNQIGELLVSFRIIFLIMGIISVLLGIALLIGIHGSGNVANLLPSGLFILALGIFLIYGYFYLKKRVTVRK